MELTYRKKKLERQCTDPKEANKALGAEQAKRLRQRVDDLLAAPSLAEFRQLPGRCHELTADRAGQLSLDLNGPYRLILVPTASPPPTMPSGGLDWSAVTAVEVIEITDTHE